MRIDKVKTIDYLLQGEELSLSGTSASVAVGVRPMMPHVKARFFDFGGLKIVLF